MCLSIKFIRYKRRPSFIDKEDKLDVNMKTTFVIERDTVYVLAARSSRVFSSLKDTIKKHYKYIIT